jgi:hypothetical protein
MSSGQKNILDLQTGFGNYLDVVSDNVVNNIYDNLNQKGGNNMYSVNNLNNKKQRLFSESASSNDRSYLKSGVPACQMCRKSRCSCLNNTSSYLSPINIVDSSPNMKEILRAVDHKGERQRLALENKLSSAIQTSNANVVGSYSKQLKCQQELVN